MTTPNETVEKLVQRGAVSVHPDDTVQTMAETFAREGVGAAVVRDADGKLLGIVSERDLVRAMADEQIDIDADRASELMSYDVATVSPSDRVADVAKVMLAGEVRHLPVVEGDTLVGVISIRDVLDAYVNG